MANAVLYDVLNAILKKIQNRGLIGIGADNIIAQRIPSDRDADLPAVKFPCIVIAPAGPEGLDSEAGMTSQDDIVYRILIAILASDVNNVVDSRFNLYLTWRESIRKLFHDSASGAVTINTVSAGTSQGGIVYNVTVQPLDVVDKAAWFNRAKYASGLILNVVSREPRG